jgi:hypothetical protein
MYSKHLTHHEPALLLRHSCNIAILPYRSLTATFNAAILFTAHIHALHVLVRRSLRLSLSLAYRSSPHRNALHVAPISLIAPISRRRFRHLVRRGASLSIRSPWTRSRTSSRRIQQRTILEFLSSVAVRRPLPATCRAACRKAAVGHSIEHCDAEVAKTTLENPSDQPTGSSKSRPVSGLWLANNSSSDRE